MIKLGLNLDQVGTNNTMTHVLVLSANVKRNERSWQTLEIGNVGFKNLQ